MKCLRQWLQRQSAKKLILNEVWKECIFPPEIIENLFMHKQGLSKEIEMD
jgi:hypothetical protein